MKFRQYPTARRRCNRFTRTPPDVILLDLLLPRLSGPDVLKKLKADPATKAIPVIVLSGMSQRNEENFLSQGAEAYFEKSQLELEKGSARLLAPWKPYSVSAASGRAQDSS